MIRLLAICCIAIVFLFAWAPVQASTLHMIYSANTFGVYSPCPS